MTRPISDPVDILLVVTPHFNMAGTMAFIDPFRAANYLGGRVLFRWHLASETGGLCYASNGLAVDTVGFDEVRDTQPKLVIVSSSWTPEAFASPALKSLLRWFARAGCYIGGIDTAAFILADMGLLQGRRATVHYEHIDSFGERFPDVEVSEDLFVHDGKVGTCCGGSAAADFALLLLRDMAGDAITNDCAKYLFHAAVRGSGTHQTDTRLEPLGNTAPPKVRKAIEIMERHLEDPIPIPEICRQTDISQRQLDRLFRSYVKTSPQLYYRDIRLDRARGLVTQTELPMSEVALACGFASQVHFSRAYRARFGLAPTKDRIEGRVPFEFRAWPMYRKSDGAAN